MDDSQDAIVESRKELMVSPSAPENPTFTNAHFLKPSLTKGISELPSFSLPSLPPTFDPQTWPLKVQFHGWKNPLEGYWKEWVTKMASSHSSTWIKAGIYSAVFTSTYKFNINRDLIAAVAEKWCPDTNSFVFPWGEATVTLEDMFIAGFPVLGLPFYEPVEAEESIETLRKLVQGKCGFQKTPACKALHLKWLQKFMDSGSEIEHEAFLSLWLSKFVFPNSSAAIHEFVFPIAIHLARGIKIALAPAVLANIYRDLTVFKQWIVALTAMANTNGKLSISIQSPFQLVLVWVWERFVKLSPLPNVIKNGEPRLARWNNLKCNIKNVRSLLDSSTGRFCWRPYAKTLENWDMPKLYKENEMWVPANSGFDEEMLSFIQCWRVSDLVGIDCIEQYFPHRVARQFGFDQDVPGCVAGSKTSREDAWNCYIRPVTEVECYVPSRMFEARVTKRYLDWWTSLGLDKFSSSDDEHLGRRRAKFRNLHEMIREHAVECVASAECRSSTAYPSSSSGKKNASISLERSISAAQILERKRSCESLVGHVDHVKQSETQASSGNIKIEEIVETNTKCDTQKRMKGGETSVVVLVNHEKRSKPFPKSYVDKNHEMDNLLVPPGFPPKRDRLEMEDSSKEDNLTVAEILKSKQKQDVLNNGQMF